MAEEIKPGKYQHFKGQFYEVICVARDTETKEERVIYRALYDSKEFGKNAIWDRAKISFLEKVVVDGKEVPRFRRIENGA